MSRKKRSLQNVAVALVSEIVVALVGMFFPSAIIVNYGSEANGLITSLQQMMQYFALIEGGLGGAAIFALYKPLAEEDGAQVQRILSSARKLYSRLGWCFAVLVVLTSLVYPWLIADVEYPKWMVSVLFCLIGINGATQLLFIGKYKVLLNASQNNRYVVLLNSLSTCLFSLIIIAAAYCRVHILLAVALGCSAYLIRALGYYLVVRKRFPQYSFREHTDGYELKNRKEVLVEYVLSMIVMNSSILILSFSRTDMAELSVFSVYNLVLTAVLMITNAVHNGVSAGFGDLISRNDISKLQNAYSQYEILYQIFWTVVFSCTCALYPSFISVYTADFTDAVYIRPYLCVIFGIYGAVWSVRIQQIVITVAAGKYAEIQKTSIIETVLVLLLSIAGLYIAGLEGLMTGRCLVALYRMVWLICFNHREIIRMNVWFTMKNLLVSAAVIGAVCLLNVQMNAYLPVDNYFAWVIYALIVAGISGLTGATVIMLTNRKEACLTMNRFFFRLGEYNGKDE